MSTRLQKLMLLICLGGMLLPSAARAQEVRQGKRGDELEDRIPAVSGALFLKKGRHELAPLFDLTLADPFRQKLIGGLYYAYHLEEGFALSLRGGATLLARDSGAVQVCPTLDACAGVGDAALDRLPGNFVFTASASAEVAPLYGKLNIIAEQVLHFDFFAEIGLGAVGLKSTSGGGPTVSLSIPVGVGQRFFFGDWFALRLEFQDLLYFQKDVGGQGRLRGQLAFTVGASFFFPTVFSDEGAQ